MAKTPTHTFKLDNDVWQLFKDKCAKRGRTASEIIVSAICMYLDNDDNADEIDKSADLFLAGPKMGRPRADDDTSEPD